MKPSQAARELLSRRQAARSLIAFTEYTHANYLVAEHHRRIAEKLEAVERGEIDRLMVFMPPRHGKSELASRRFPAWYMGRNPGKQIIAASHSSELATDFGRDVRNIVASPDFQNVFEVGLREDSKAANRWNTDDGGAYIAAGVGSSITGRGADILLIDDPLKDRQEADSETTRERIWSWYTSTAFTRLMPGGAVILIQTRWHEDDLAGRLLEKESDWTVLELPAIDNGEALWPEWFPLPLLERMRASIGPRDWSALYQQRPQPDDGTYFHKDWFGRYDARPENLSFYGTSDYAVTEGGDFTEHAVWGVNEEDDIYLIDGWYGQTTSDTWIEQLLNLIKTYKPYLWVGEAGQIRRAVEPFLKKRMRERADYCRIEWLPSIGDKAARARGFQARASLGKVFIPNTPYGDRALDQLLRFPTGKHDDFVDAASLIGRALENLHKPRKKTIDKPAPDRWDKAFKRSEMPDYTWKTA